MFYLHHTCPATEQENPIKLWLAHMLPKSDKWLFSMKSKNCVEEARRPLKCGKMGHDDIEKMRHTKTDLKEISVISSTTRFYW